MNRVYHSLFFFIFLYFSYFLYELKQTIEKDRIELETPCQNKSFLILGDSLSKGDLSFNWVDKLKNSLPQSTFHIIAKNGATIRDALEMLKKNFNKASCKYQVILIFIGHNDIRKKNLLLIQDLKILIDHIKEYYPQSRPIFISIPPLNEGFSPNLNTLRVKFNENLKNFYVIDQDYKEEKSFFCQSPPFIKNNVLRINVILNKIFGIPYSFFTFLYSLHITHDCYHLNEISGQSLLKEIKKELKIEGISKQ